MREVRVRVGMAGGKFSCSKSLRCMLIGKAKKPIQYDIVIF